MNNSKEFINKAKKFYKDQNLFEAKLQLNLALKCDDLEEKLKFQLYILISDVSEKINHFDDAINYLLKYLEKDKFNLKAMISLANIYQKKRQYKESEKFYLNVLEIDKVNLIALTSVAILYENLGQFKKAKVFYKKILEINPKNIGVIFNLSKMNSLDLNEKLISSIKTLLEKDELDNFNSASSYFLLSLHEKNKKDLKKEIYFLEKANLYAFKSKEKYNKQLLEYWLNIIPKKIYSFTYQNEKLYDETKKIFPIFIIGLPRSGSTLIESIISSGRTKIENLGETNLINWSLLNANKKDLLKPVFDNKKIFIDTDQITKNLLDILKNMNLPFDQKKNYFVEKSLENFFYLELILKVFPNAIFLNPKRNLFDNIFAIYSQFLNDVPWSHDIEYILKYIDNYLITIKYFKKKFPNKIFSFSFEDFTNNPKIFSQKIFKFCKLEWDMKSLQYYKRNDLYSKTASNNQIRDGVKRYDKKKYSKYKEILNDYVDQYDWLVNL
tara:strand:- start:107 stop:1597 length:1491 start_codon:yes stop_codon:yes gene_type:complete